MDGWMDGWIRGGWLNELNYDNNKKGTNDRIGYSQATNGIVDDLVLPCWVFIQ